MLLNHCGTADNKNGWSGSRWEGLSPSQHHMSINLPKTISCLYKNMEFISYPISKSSSRMLARPRLCRVPTGLRRHVEHVHIKNTAVPESLALTATALAFLPWNGCEVPGSPYSTGVKGIPGKDCQQVYQPAIEAEAKAVARIRQQQVRLWQGRLLHALHPRHDAPGIVFPIMLPMTTQTR